MVRGDRGPSLKGLGALRRSGAVTELLFLYECATLEPNQLRPVAEHLHLTVQAVSHSYRQLQRRGLIEVRDGKYRPTVAGVAWLHETFGALNDDLAERLAHLHVIRSTRAVAGADLAAGELVSLELESGVLTARPGGGGASRGRVVTAAPRGGLAEVSDLEGIVPVEPAPLSIRTIPDAELTDPRVARRARAVRAGRDGLVAAMGVEAYAVLSAARIQPLERFAVAAVGREAAQIGVPVTIVVAERELPRLLAEFTRGHPPRLDVAPLFSKRSSTVAPRRDQVRTLRARRSRSSSTPPISSAPARTRSS